MEGFLIIVIAILMVIVVVLLLSIKANQDYVQSLKQRENEKQSKLAALETKNKELSAKLKNNSGFNTDVSTEGNSPEFDELNEKYQNLQEKYQKVYEELELQQKETREARLAAEKAEAEISAAEKPDPSAEEKSLREQIERLEHSCGTLRINNKQLQENLTKAEKRCEELEYGLNRSGEMRASETEENEELRSELEEVSAQNTSYLEKLADAARQIKDLRTEHQKQIEQEQHTVVEIQKELDSVLNENDKFRKKLAEAAAQMTAIRTENQSLSEQLAAHAENSVSVTEVEEKLDAGEREKKILRASLETAEKQNAEYQTQILNLKQELEQLPAGTEDSALREELRKANEQIQKLRENLANTPDSPDDAEFLREELENANSQIKNLRAELEAKADVPSRTPDEIEISLRADMDALEVQNSEYRLKLKEAAQQIVQLRQELNQKPSALSDTENLQKQLADLQDEKNRIFAENEKLQEQLADALHQVDDLSTELITGHQNDNSTLEEAETEISALHTALETDHKKHEEELAALREKHREALFAQKKEAESQQEAAAHQIADLTAQLTGLRNTDSEELTALKSENTTLIQQKQELEEKLNE